MLTGSLPFTASDPMEWVHCHIARQPVPPSERVEKIPAPVSHIIMKLLAKTAEERYQTAAGVERDLRRCLAAWELHGRIDPFALGAHDTPDRLLIPEKLYGRAREVETLRAAFARIVESGRPELVLVSGYAGIGKSAVVNELHKALVPSRGLFASGKFDQHKRDIPYATLVQAFQRLLHPLLSKSEAELVRWRKALLEALGPNGRIITDLVPELERIIGEQPAVPVLPPKDAQRRVQLLLRRFLGVFARPDHPLALFLDDLQWLDPATLDLLEDLLTQGDVQHLLLIGAYRDNEVDAAHPLMRTLGAIKTAGAVVQEIPLEPLVSEHVSQLIADALRCQADRVRELAQLVHGKTAGNPFFVIQFLSTLTEEGLVAFDHGLSAWSWDLGHIHAKGYTDNVVDLMIGRIVRLPADTQTALQQLACLGNIATIGTLSILHDASEEALHARFREAMRLELVDGLESSYRFVHDRVHEAAYALIPRERRAEAHLRIGRLLAAHTPPDRREAVIFDIVSQLNRGAILMTAQDEREQLAEFNLVAGRRAQASSAYISALSYLKTGASLLADDSWQRRHALSFSLELALAQCEFVTGAVAQAEERLSALSARAATVVEQSAVACLRIDLYTTLDHMDRAVGVCLDYLLKQGIQWSPHPTKEEGQREYEQIWSQLGSRAIAELIDLPLMDDPSSLATLDVLIRILPAAWFTDVNAFTLAVCKALNLSLERGNSDGSCVAYVCFGMVAGPHFGNYMAGFQFGRLGYELVDQRGLKRFQARTYLWFGSSVMPWTQHVRAGRDLLRRAFEGADKIGDVTVATYSCHDLNTNLLAAGDPLTEVQRQAEHGLAFAQKARFGHLVDTITTQVNLIRALRGVTPNAGAFDDRRFDEPQLERHSTRAPRLALADCWYWIAKLQACVFSGDHVSAVKASLRAQQVLGTSPP